MLFTHRGLSGPAILQISSYWRAGEAIEIDMAPGVDVSRRCARARAENGRQPVATVLAERLPRRLAQMIAETAAPRAIWPMRPTAAAAAGRGGERLARQAGGLGGLSHRRGHPRRRRHPRPRLPHHGRPKPSPGSTSSARWSTSPAGSAAIISSGPGPAAGAPARRRDRLDHPQWRPPGSRLRRFRAYRHRAASVG